MAPGPRDKARRKLVLAGGGGHFFVAPNPRASASAPWYEKPEKSQVDDYNGGIEYAAAKEGVDANLVRAIMYVETTHGYYDEYAAPFKLNDTILPMNVSVVNWGEPLGLTREDLQQPLTNIEVGVKILKGIAANLPGDAPVSAVATLYNSLSATKVTSYGARVEAVYAQRLWQRR